MKVKLNVSIDEWDKYCQEWNITQEEAIETQENGNWFIETNEDIARELLNNNMVS